MAIKTDTVDIDDTDDTLDTVDTVIADGRLDRLASGKDKTIPAEDVWKKLGL